MQVEPLLLAQLEQTINQQLDQFEQVMNQQLSSLRALTRLLALATAVPPTVPLTPDLPSQFLESLQPLSQSVLRDHGKKAEQMVEAYREIAKTYPPQIERGVHNGSSPPVAQRIEFHPSAIESQIVSWVQQSGRAWKANELVRYLMAHSNLADTRYDPANIYQALSRAVRQGKLVREGYGVYGPPKASSNR